MPNCSLSPIDSFQDEAPKVFFLTAAVRLTGRRFCQLASLAGRLIGLVAIGTRVAADGGSTPAPYIKCADIIAVYGEPLADIGVVEKVLFVMKGGEILKRAGR